MEIITMVLIILIPVIIIGFIRDIFTKRINLEMRVEELEREVDILKKKVQNNKL